MLHAKSQLNGSREKLTSQKTTLLKVVHALALVALAQLLADQTGHHAAHPLLADDGVAGIVNGDVVFEVDALVGRRHGGLLGEEGGGLGSRHCGLVFVGFGESGRGRVEVRSSRFPAGSCRGWRWTIGSCWVETVESDVRVVGLGAL